MIGAMDQTLFRERPGEPQMSRLTAGVDSGVGPAGTVDRDRHVEQIAEGFFHHLLNGQGVVLPLPASIGSAAIGEGQSIIHRDLDQARSKKNGTQIAR